MVVFVSVGDRQTGGQQSEQFEAKLGHRSDTVHQIHFTVHSN